MSDMRNYHRIYEQVLRGGNPVREKTLDGWHRRAVTTREALLIAKEQYQADLKELEATYSPKVFAEKRTKADSEFQVLTDIARKRIEADLQEVLESKRAAYDRSFDAPSEAVLRLMQTLNMRDTLSVSELAAISGKLENNVPALRLLGDIARRHGLSFPDLGDPTEFERMMQAAEQFAADKLSSVGTDHKDLGYKEMLFWEHPGEGEDRYFFGGLDGAGFTSEQIQAATEAAQRPTWTPPATTGTDQTGTAAAAESDDVWSEVTVRNQRLDTIANQFHVSVQQIRDANPGKNLDQLYAGMTLLVPSTRFTHQPDASGGHVQYNDVRPVARPVYEVPEGPHGEEVGDDIQVFPEA